MKSIINFQTDKWYVAVGLALTLAAAILSALHFGLHVK